MNAVSYAGLSSAAGIAHTLGHTAEAEAWEARAALLREAWRNAFDLPAFVNDVANERTAICGLWPFGIAAAPAYRAMLERRWQASRTHATAQPLWTYFTVAEAHQWLLLDRPDRVPSTLDHLWRQQPTPGLYTLWEGDGEEGGLDCGSKSVAGRGHPT